MKLVKFLLGNFTGYHDLGIAYLELVIPLRNKTIPNQYAMAVSARVIHAYDNVVMAGKVGLFLNKVRHIIPTNTNPMNYFVVGDASCRVVAPRRHIDVIAPSKMRTSVAVCIGVLANLTNPHRLFSCLSEQVSPLRRAATSLAT